MAGILDFITTPTSKAEDPLAAREKWLGLASIFQGMTMDPTAGQQGIQQQIQGIQQQRQQGVANKAKSDRVAMAVRLLAPKHPELAKFVAQGLMTPEEAITEARKVPKDDRTAQIKNYEYWTSKGKTPAEAEALAKGGQTINVGGGGETEWVRETAKLQAKRFGGLMDAGAQASNAAGSVTILNALGEAMDKGVGIPVPIRKFVGEGFSGPIDAYRSMLYNVAQSLKKPGSGPQTDKDFEVLMAQAGPISGDPRARQIAHQFLINVAQRDMQISDIATQVISGGLDRTEGNKLINELRKQPLMDERMREYIYAMTGTDASAPIAVGDIDAANAALQAALAEKTKRQQQGQ